MGEGQHNNAICYALVHLWNKLAILYKAIKSSYQKSFTIHTYAGQFYNLRCPEHYFISSSKQ